MNSISQFSRELQSLSALPLRDAWSVAGMTVQFSFERLATPLRPLSGEAFVGLDIRSNEWSRVVVFGEMLVDGGGSPIYCLSQDDFGIYMFDVEAAAVLEPLNTTAEAFVRSYAIARAAAFSKIDLTSAAVALRDLDPKVYDANNDWRLFIESLKQSALAV
jgi:hypothetical protein